jgi:nucleotide-binding universal stress UspA family protein
MADVEQADEATTIEAGSQRELIMFQRILVPVDFTEKSSKAVEKAYELASKGSEIVLLHTVELIEHVDFEELKPFYEHLTDSARKGLKKLAARSKDGVSIETVVINGHRVGAIVDYARNNHTDLIVMASHRIGPDHTGNDWASISYAVTVLATCPVLLLK